MKKKGISLITLIITIIVVIILAGVVIFSMAKNNPVDKANEAVFKQNLATYKDELEMYHLNEISKNSGDYDRKTLNKDESNIKEVIKSMKEEDTKKFEIVEGELVYKGDKEDETGVPFKENATIDGKAYSHQNPLIPAGFYPVNTADASWTKKEWNNGLVIRDANGNEYVWVPVASASEFKYTNWNEGVFGGTDDLTATELSTIDTSVTKYGGFYIARYEASNNSGKAQSKKGATTWTSITYNDAKPAAEAVDTDNGYETVTSTLITGKMWDTTVAWMERASINVIDSSTWGNHSNNTATGAGTKQVTGYSETWKAKNIYDLAGNVWEWTTEIYSTSGRVDRGGYYNHCGSSHPVSFRFYGNPTTSNDGVGFRFALFIN